MENFPIRLLIRLQGLIRMLQQNGALSPSFCVQAAHSPQKPDRKARERKEDKILEWKNKKWPEISARAACEGRTIVFVDESGLSQRPARKRTWAPEGQTPILELHFHWKKLSAIAGVSLTTPLPNCRLPAPTQPSLQVT